jgi:hypothetical protein
VDFEGAYLMRKLQLVDFRLAFIFALIPSFLGGASNPKKEITFSARISDCSEGNIHIDVSVKNNMNEPVALRKSFLRIENIKFKLSGSSRDPGRKGGGKAQGNATIEFQEFDGPKPVGKMELIVAPKEIFGKSISFDASEMLRQAINEKGRIELQTRLEISNHGSSSWDTLTVCATVEGACE